MSKIYLDSGIPYSNPTAVPSFTSVVLLPFATATTTFFLLPPSTTLDITQHHSSAFRYPCRNPRPSFKNHFALKFVKIHKEDVAWNVYEEAIVKRFGYLNEDLMAELKYLMYESTMKNVDVMLLPLRGCEMVLGIQWLSTLGTIEWNFKEPVMNEAPSHGSQTELQLRVQEFKDVFAIPYALPPQRSFDHKILLKDESTMVNIRPYRYPPNQKDLIEAMVNELMETGVVRPSHIPYSSPIVLNGFLWNPEAQIAFKKLEQAMTEALVFTLPDFQAEFVIDTDASGYVTKLWTTNPMLKAIVKKLQNWQLKNSKYTWHDQQIRRKGKCVVGVDDQLRRTTVVHFHTSAIGSHSGVQATLKKIEAFFYWKGMRKTRKEIVRTCDVCQRNNVDLSVYPGLLAAEPIKLLERKIVKQQNRMGVFGLIQWCNGSEEDATWEDLADMVKRWFWDLNGDGVFRVMDVRILLDETFLPKMKVPTRWIKSIPIKVNVFAWKLFLDRLPTRSNLARRNVSIPSLACPLCDLALEDSSHLFFGCFVAKDVQKLICRWWNLDFQSFDLYDG
nr:RNA-directed DNA polymerase, eukaryota [Tanacetum cinerariifolium]